MPKVTNTLVAIGSQLQLTFPPVSLISCHHFSALLCVQLPTVLQGQRPSLTQISCLPLFLRSFQKLPNLVLNPRLNSLLPPARCRPHPKTQFWYLAFPSVWTSRKQTGSDCANHKKKKHTPVWNCAGQDALSSPAGIGSFLAA